MPTEVRRITFRPGELAEALRAESLATDVEVDGAILAFTRGEGGVRQIEIAERNAEGGAAKAVTLDADKIGSALVRYCLDHGIPIPQNATRSLTINNGNLALFVHIEEEAEDSSVSLPDYYDYDFYG